MLKLAGMVIVILGSAALGLHQACMYMNRLNNLHEVKKAFLYIQGEIRYMSTPLPELLEEVAGRVKEPFRRFFTEVAAELSRKNAGMVREIWKECYHKEINKDVLEREAEEEFLEMGGQLGGTDSRTQEKAIDYFLEKWEFIIEKRQKEKTNKLRLYYVCGVAGGVLMVIILV